MTSLLSDRNVVPKPKRGYQVRRTHATRHRPTACDTIVCRISKMAGIGDNLAIFPNIVVVPYPKQAYA